MPVFFEDPVRTAWTCEREVRARLDEVARRRGQLPGRLLGDLLESFDMAEVAALEGLIGHADAVGGGGPAGVCTPVGSAPRTKSATSWPISGGPS